MGPFKATLTIPDKPFRWTAQQSGGAAKVTWSGGSLSGYVTIQGSGVPTADNANVNFICSERVAAGQFTIPPEVMMSLPPDPAGRGVSLFVTSQAMATFQSRGLDIGQLQFSSTVQ